MLSQLTLFSERFVANQRKGPSQSVTQTRIIYGFLTSIEIQVLNC